MKEQIYLFSGQIEEKLNKILTLLDEKTKRVVELEKKVEELEGKLKEKEKEISRLNNEYFEAAFGNLKKISSEKKQEIIQEIDELIRAIDAVSRKIAKKK